MNVYAANGQEQVTNKKEAARRGYVDGMAASFKAMGRSLEPGGMVGVVFAHTDPDAWSTLIEGLLDAGLIPNVSWPIDTELENKVSRLGQARLSTSVWMACTPRQEDAGQAFLGDVMDEMRPVIRERLLYFWNKGIRGADFFISAIGPALSVFGRHSRVLRPDGGEVTVREFLNLVRKESTQVALEQVLRGADLGVVDPITRQYVTWVWSYSRAPLEAGETIALCLATGAEYGSIVRLGSIGVETREGSKKLVKLLTVKERIRADEDLGLPSAARPAPLIDQLHRAAHFWGINRPDELATYRGALGETRWAALRTLGQAVAECLPDGDEDRRLINGLLGSNVMAVSAPASAGVAAPERLPGFEEESDA
jgi:adenine-specific DNA methylase